MFANRKTSPVIHDLHIPSVVEFTQRFELHGSYFIYGGKRKQTRPRIPLLCQPTATQNIYVLTSITPDLSSTGALLDARYALAPLTDFVKYSERIQPHRSLGKSYTKARVDADADAGTLFCFPSELIGKTYPEHWRQQLILKRDRERV